MEAALQIEWVDNLAVVLILAKPGVFLAGADPRELLELASPPQLLRQKARRGERFYDRAVALRGVLAITTRVRSSVKGS